MFFLDGIELKRGPVDLTSKVSVIEQRYVERGSPGQAGRTVIEKKWVSGGEGNDGNAKKVDYGHRGGPDNELSGVSGPNIGSSLINDSSSRNLGNNSPFASLGDSLNSGPLNSALGNGPSAGTSSYPPSNAAPSPNRYSSVGPLGDLRHSQQPQSPPQSNTPLNLYESRLN